MEETAGQDLWSVVGRQQICRFIPNAKRFTREIVTSNFHPRLADLPAFQHRWSIRRQRHEWFDRRHRICAAVCDENVRTAPGGIGIDLWRRIADRLHLRYEFQEMPLNAMIEAVASNRIDVAVAAITITADRQQRADFTHSYYTSGLAIGVRRTANENHLFGILRKFFLRRAFSRLYWRCCS